MDLNMIWKAALIVIVGTLLLRIAGRKSIAQMTLAQTVIMIAIGSLLIQPVSGKNIWMTFLVGGVLILTLILIEYAQVKGDGVENLITGKSIVLIEHGSVNEKNLRKLRLTVDQLEMQLRHNNITKISDVDWATLEPNGQLGYALKQEAQPITKKEFQQLMDNIQQLQQSIGNLAPSAFDFTHLNKQLTQLNNQLTESQNRTDIFSEVEDKDHKHTPPRHLQ